jgi:hypothetical protein
MATVEITLGEYRLHKCLQNSCSTEDFRLLNI